MIVSILGQARENYVLQGYMGVQGGESFSYRLELTDSSENYLSGYSYLYKNKDNDVKTAVVVQRNRNDKSLHLQETSIIYNRGFESKAVICLVESEMKFDEKEKQLKGSLITQTINSGGTCSRGTILFSNLKEIDALFAAPSVPATKTASSNITVFQKPKANPTQKLHHLMQENKKKEEEEARKQTIAMAQEKAKQVAAANQKPEVKQITEGKEGVYEWNSNFVILKIWDGSQEDGDRVNLYLNQQLVLNNYTLLNQEKELRLELKGDGIHTITIEALNEGAQPPNTANISISDGETIHEIVAFNKIGKKALIRIKKKQN